jgi:hypothetical protein
MPVIPATQEADVRRIIVWLQPQADSSKEPISASKNWVQWHIPIIPATQETQIGRSESWPVQA